jgi:hypothetical protein
MTEMVWLDEHGRPRPTYPCFTCGEPQPGGVYAGQILRMWGWQPPQTTTAVGHCGHAQERLPVPLGEGQWWLVPVWNQERDQLWPFGVGAGP